MISTYNDLHKIVRPYLTHYIEDLEVHDRKSLEKNDYPFIYGYRRTGTGILFMKPSLTDYFGEAMEYTEIFSHKRKITDVNEACDILQRELVWVNPGADNKEFLYFDGSKLHKKSKEQIVLIWKDHVNKLRLTKPFKLKETV